MSHKNRLIQNFPQKNQKKNLINGLINGQHIRSSSVIDKKNRVKVSNNNNKKEKIY